MKKDNKFEDVLNECLEHIINGGDVEACLMQHPEYAAELEPLLKTALAMKNAADIKPRPEFRQQAASDFQAAVRELPPHKARSPFRWQLRWVLPVAVIIVLVLSGGGTVMAAANSLPDSPLYRVKLATEAVQLALTRSDLAKAELYARFADKRVAEIVKMAEKGDTVQVEKVTERMDSQLIAMANLTAAGEGHALVASYSVEQAPVANPPAKTSASATTVLTTATETPTVTSQTLAPTVQAPPVTLAQAPPPTVTLTQPQTGGEGENKGHGKSAAQNPSEQEKLKELLIEKITENLKVLQDELDKAPESLKLALQRAIEVAQSGYEEAINNLEQVD